ncbi:MAG: hypothetical protein Q8Q22_00410, partial [bacterium]|nr:hypothetical protein [bacterium]
SDFLKEVSVVWSALAGKHTFRAVVSTDLSSNKNLISSESSEASLDISRIEVPLTLDAVKEETGKIINAVTKKVDELTSVFADKLESVKKPILSSGTSGAVLGTATNTGNGIPASVYNTGIDVMSTLVRNWMWTLSGLAVLGFVWTFRF